MVVLKIIRLMWWWRFTIEKNEFHHSLYFSSDVPSSERMAKRTIAHLLDEGYAELDISESLIDEAFNNKGEYQ